MRQDVNVGCWPDGNCRYCNYGPSKPDELVWTARKCTSVKPSRPGFKPAARLDPSLGRSPDPQPDVGFYICNPDRAGKTELLSMVTWYDLLVKAKAKGGRRGSQTL